MAESIQRRECNSDTSTDSELENRHPRHKYRHRSKKHRADSPSSKRSRSRSGSSSPDNERRNSRSSHKRHRRSRKDRSTSRSSDDSSYERARRKKSKEKRKRRIGKISWGKYGVISHHDLNAKRSEFQQWLLEVKDVTLDKLSARQEQAHFKDFVEDYNTAQLPHKKFYNLDKWEESKLRKSKRMPSSFMFDDERTRHAERQLEKELKRHEEQSYMLKEIRENREKVDAMRRQKELRTQMQTLYRMGRVEEAQRIRDRLRPDEKCNETEDFQTELT